MDFHATFSFCIIFLHKPNIRVIFAENFPAMKRLFILSIVSLLSIVALRADDFALMRERLLKEIVLGDPSDPALSLSENSYRMQQYVGVMVNVAGITRQDLRRDTTFLWPDIPHLSGNRSFTPAHVCESYRRLMLMARAYSWPGSRLYHDEDLLADIRYGLSFLYSHAYNERTRMIGNWWEWRIGIPWYYSYIVSMLRDNLSPEELSAFERSTAAFTYSFARNGDLTFANQASICRNLLFIGILTDNDTYIRTALEAAVPAFCDASTPAQRMQAINRQNAIIRRQRASARVSSLVHKEGLYPDGTFIQHSSVPYIGTYGTEVIAMASYLAILLPGTQYSVPAEITASLPVWISGAYLPAIWQSEMMLMFMGRDVEGDVVSNARNVLFSIASAALLMEDEAERNDVLVRTSQMLAHSPLPWEQTENPVQIALRGRLKKVSEVPGVQEVPSVDSSSLPLLGGEGARRAEEVSPFSRVYSAGDRAIHQTSSWRFGLSMSSNRIAKYECFIRPTARQNTQGWYQGDGMTYLYLPSDPDQYRNYFSHVDPYRLPGTTVVQLPREVKQAVQPLYAMPAAAADEARAGGVSLQGCSSAMMQLVGSVSDLRAKKSWFMMPREVVCLGADISCSDTSQVITTVENRRMSKKVEKVLMVGSSLAYLDGVGAYWFPDSAQLFTNNTNNCTELYINHGAAPQQASYSYVLLPEMPLSDAQLYSRQPDVRILSNTPALQAVRHFGLNLIAANFWQKGSLRDNGIADVRSDGTAALMMQQSGDMLTLSVADPTWDRSSMQILIEGLYDLRSANKSDKVKVSSLAGSYTVIDIDSRNALGMSFDVILEKKEPAFVQTWSPLPY